MNEQPNYVNFIDLHFGAIMTIAQRVAEHLGNTALEIVSRSIPLIVPVPNALGVYNAALTSLHWSNGAALALSLAVECIFFIMFEITLKQWDGYQEDEQYKYPLIAMCSVSFVCVIVVMAIVYSIEQMAGGATVLALLPVLSACTSVGIGLLRWHNARSTRTQTRKERTQVRKVTQVLPALSDDEVTQGDTEVTQVLPDLDATAQAIIAAIKAGNATPYAISKHTGITQTTLKRKRKDGSYIGRLPQLVAAGVLANGGTDYRINE